MNILITSFSLLMVLALSSSLFWKEALSSTFSFCAVKGVYEAARGARNRLEKKEFARFKDTNVEVDKERKRKTERTKVKDFHSHRLENPPTQQGRFGMMAIRELEQREKLVPIAQRLLLELYGHTEWFDPKIAAHIIDKIASSIGEFEKASFVQELDVEEYKLWYLMMKGTQNYDIMAKKGYAPLEDYIDFTSSLSVKHTCHFPFASFPLLKSMFGEDVAQDILKIEKRKWEEDVGRRRKYCLKKELLPLVNTHRQSAELTQLIETYCYFNQSKGKKSFVQGEDKKSGIVIRREVP